MKGFATASVLIVAILLCGMLGFFWRDIEAFHAPNMRAAGRLIGVNPTAQVSPEDLFLHNYHHILADAYERIDPTTLKYDAIKGMVSSLGDPHSVFFTPTESQDFESTTAGNFYGVGARLGADALGAKVVNVFSSGPAFKAGLRAGNVIVGVDGKSVAGKDLNKIVDKIKGPEGTIVSLSVVQNPMRKAVTINIRRAKIIAPTVMGQMIPRTKFGYLAISQFSSPTTAQFDHQLAKLEKSHIKGLVIDLRGNPGGLLKTAQAMLSRFVANKLVVSMHELHGVVESVRTKPAELHKFDYPIAVLIDQDSASAAEIFSGCLQDYGKAVLVGTHSYGKATVQNVFPFLDGASAKITIAKYYLPNGEFIGRKVDADGDFISGGLKPDVEVELNTDKPITPGDPKTDNQLAAAVKVLQSKQQ